MHQSQPCSIDQQLTAIKVMTGAVLMQIYDQIYLENFERTRKEEEQRAREAALKEQQAAWGPPPAGPPGLQNPGWGAEGAGNGWQGGAYSSPFPLQQAPIERVLSW